MIVEDNMLRNRWKFLLLILSISNPVLLSQIPDDIQLTKPFEVSDEEHAIGVIDEIVQGVRTGDLHRILRVIPNDRRASMADSLRPMFQGFRSIEQALFTLKPIALRKMGNRVGVTCVLPESQQDDTLNLICERGLDSWQLANPHGLVQRITAFLRRNAPHADGRAHSLLSKVSGVSLTTGLTIVESQHILVPKRLSSWPGPTKWFITQSDAQEYVGKVLLSTPSDGDYVPLNSSVDVGFVLDPMWHRIIYASGNWIKSYGDWPGDYEFLESWGLRALLFPDGMINVFVTEARKGEIAHLRYDHNTGQLSLVRTIKGSIGRPMDVDMHSSWFAWPNYRLWVSDKSNGIMEVDKDGNTLRQFTQYTFQGNSFPLNNVTRICLSSSGYLAFIDRNRSAFVVTDWNLNVISVNIFGPTNPPSKLSFIGRAWKENWIVTDANLNMIHNFSNAGRYLGSFKSFSSSAAMYPAHFSGITGVNFFRQPLAFNGSADWNTNPNIVCLDNFSIGAWGNSNGFASFLPGADIINFSVSSSQTAIQFDYDVTNYSRFTSGIYDQNNVLVHNFAPWTYTVFPGHRTDAISYSQLGTGLHTLRITVVPQSNSNYGSYKQNPVELTYVFSRPPTVSISGPSEVYHTCCKGQPVNQYTWTANVSGRDVSLHLLLAEKRLSSEHCFFSNRILLL
jgi:hypothetical protein